MGFAAFIGLRLAPGDDPPDGARRHQQCETCDGDPHHVHAREGSAPAVPAEPATTALWYITTSFRY